MQARVQAHLLSGVDVLLQRHARSHALVVQSCRAHTALTLRLVPLIYKINPKCRSA